MAPPRLPDKAAPIRADGSAHVARRAPQLFLENEPLPQARITDIKLQDQFATAADTRGKRQIMLAVADLLMGNLKTPSISARCAVGSVGCPRSSCEVREICHDDLAAATVEAQLPVFNSFLLGGRERWLASAYQAMSETMELIMQKAAPKAETVTLKDLAAKLAEAHSLPKVQVNTMLGEMVEDLGKHLKKGARIRISGLGILQVRKRPPRMGRNPATGEAIKIKASKKIAFRASKDLKELMM
jgi:DNA-binding protein HU-beta